VAKYPGWTRRSESGRKTSADWEHRATGWHVRHCGHPTAIHPYFAEDPDGRMVVHANGHGFDTLLQAMSAVEQLHAHQRVLVEVEDGFPRIYSWPDIREVLAEHGMDPDQVEQLVNRLKSGDLGPFF